MKIEEIKNKDIWENFLAECGEKTFLQSWNWGEFNVARGDKIWRLGIYENNTLISVALVIRVRAKRGSFLIVPHAPVLRSSAGGQKFEILNALVGRLKTIATQEKVSFIRVSSIWERNKENIAVFEKLSFRDAPIHMHYELTWELDITPGEDELLANMRKTTRYLVRQAQKNSDIKISQSKDAGDMERFQELYQETVDRHHFVAFPPDYLRNEFSAFSRDDQISIFLGTYRGELVASVIAIFWQGIAFYHHGASSTKYPKAPVSYLLQWEVIKEAKRRGCKLYNLWGIAPNEDPRHPWAGLTLFKTGFGGIKKEYVKTQDLLFSWRYYITYAFERIRKMRRGL